MQRAGFDGYLRGVSGVRVKDYKLFGLDGFGGNPAL